MSLNTGFGKDLVKSDSLHCVILNMLENYNIFMYNVFKSIPDHCQRWILRFKIYDYFYTNSKLFKVDRFIVRYTLFVYDYETRMWN